MKKKHLAAILLSVGLLGTALWGAFALYVSQDTLPPGTFVAGLELGRRHRDEALQLLDQEIAALNRKQVVFTVDGNVKNMTWEEAGITFDARAFREEVQRLEEGALWERVRTRNHFDRQWMLNMTFDSKKLQAVFTPEWEKAQFGSPVNAVRTITTNDQIRYLPGTSVQRIDWDRLLEVVPKRISGEVRRLEKNSQHESLSRQKSRPADLSVPLSKQLATLQITVPLKTVQPKITVEMLKKEGIRRKIVQFSTSLSTSGTGRVHNVDSAARSIDGRVLAPGEIFDYNEAIEYAEKTFGFQEAPVIFGGRLVPGVGGGICQVSSTLYNAAVRAGLSIVERRNHSLPVSYLPKGQDATFAKGYINFRFKNTSGHHLLIRAEVKNRQLTVKLFGDMPENVSYSLESRTTEILPPPNKYVANTSLPAGSRQILVRGKQGYVVETYRIKKVDGQAVERTLLSKDTYPAQPTVVAVRDTKGSAAGGGSGGSGGSNRGSSGTGSGKGGASGNGAGGTSTERPPNPILEDGVTGPNFR
ncbi:VanW family protein [Paenibacillus rubinfantis]|uniref:VanW family protein n=1 Tax=Paenibacillus rubinfantis TaxID=1720296 RepID=UPI00073EA9A7|nr:VanW family protein [Paenibacillus rubinfantis]